MSSKRAGRLERSATEEVPKPEIKSVRVLNKKEEEIDVTKYGKEILIEVKTENALACKLVLTAKNPDWKEPVKRFEKQWPVQPSDDSPIIVINRGKNFISFTPQVEWLKDINEHSGKTVFEVSLLASVKYAFFIGGDKNQEVDKMESKEIEIFEINIPWLYKAFAEMALEVKEGTANRVTSPLKYLSYEGVPEKMRSSKESTPWCAAFVNYVLEETGYKGEDVNPLAVENWNGSWRNWANGVKIDKPSYGALVTFGDNHIGFVVGMSKDKKKLFVLGGNQDDEVNISEYSIKSSFKYFLPKSHKTNKLESDTNFLQESYQGTIKNGGRIL